MPRPDGTRALAGAIVHDALEGRDPAPGPHLVRADGSGPRAALRDGLTIGRGRRAALRLASADASRLHARVVATPDGFAIEDAGSKNGLTLNGVRVARAPLRDGDLVALGAVELRVDGLGLSREAEAICAGPHRAHGAAAIVAAGLLLAAAAVLAAGM
jgi:predicted component of type VI protein secretion system